MSTEHEQDTLRMVDGMSSAQHAGSIESAGVYAGGVADGKVVYPAPDYGNLFCVSGSSPPAIADCSVPPSAERYGLVEPSPADALATPTITVTAAIGRMSSTTRARAARNDHDGGEA